MLGEIFYWVFNMSIAAAICGIPVLVLRCFKRIPRRVFVWFWLIPFIRLCIPFGISSKYGLMTLLSRFTTRSVTVYEIDDDLFLTFMNHIMAADSYSPITYRVNFMKQLFEVASCIWIVVALAAVIAILIVYYTTMRELKDVERLEGNIYLSDKIKSPAVYGIIKTRIILPTGYKKRDLEYILMHERAHIRRCDNLTRTLALIVVCFHWFNPFAWLFLKLLVSDIELACDEAVLSGCDVKQRKEYARALVSSVERTDVFASSFGGAKIRIRIENILSYRKISWISLVCFAIMFISIAYILLTNAS